RRHAHRGPRRPAVGAVRRLAPRATRDPRPAGRRRKRSATARRHRRAGHAHPARAGAGAPLRGGGRRHHRRRLPRARRRRRQGARVGEGGGRMITVPVKLGDRSYDVLVGKGARHRLLEVLPVGVQRAAIVTQEEIGVRVDAGIDQHVFTIDSGEEAKNLETVEDLCRRFSSWGLTRRDVIVGVGGGVVTDVAGFAAAVYHRGVPVVHVATTLVAQVDAAIGGKTGVNLREGKNLVGAFWQPAAVLCDTETLASLPEREYLSGCGEMAKYAFLGVDGLRDLPLEEAVAACVACKAEFVSGDER